MTFNFAGDVNRDLVVGLQSIRATDSGGKNSILLSSGILTYIDSSISHIILPLDACRLFENAFALEFDEDTGLYLVSDSLHNSLLSRNASFTFTLGNYVSGGSTVDITLPYNAFDLQVTAPFVNGTSRYFP